MIRNKYLKLALFTAAVLIIWNLLHFLYTTVITQGTCVFSATSDLLIPLGSALAVGFVFYIARKDD